MPTTTNQAKIVPGTTKSSFSFCNEVPLSDLLLATEKLGGAGQNLAGQARAVEREPVEWAEHRNGNLFRAEKFLRKGLYFLASHAFDSRKDFVQRVESAKIEFLSCQVRHPRAGRLQRKHQRAFEVVFRAPEFLLGNRCFLEFAKFLHHQIDHLADRL